MKDCVRVSQKVKVTLKSIQVEKAGGDPGNDLELFGSVAAFGRAPGAADGGDRMLLARDATHSMRVAEGETFPQQGTLGEVIVDVVPRGGSSVALRINLLDEDGGLTTDDSIGDELVEVRFETGWRRDVQVYLTGSNARVAVTLHIDPI